MSLTTTRSLVAEFAADVARDLALVPKQIQSKYLYDALGSSLFEAICRLPWYRITRSETAAALATCRVCRGGARRRRGDDRRARLRQRRKDRAAGRGARTAGRQRARPPYRYFVAGARAERAAAEPAATRLRGGALVDLRGRVTDGGRGASRRQHDARPAARLEHRKLRSARCGTLSRSHPRDPRRRRSSAARRRPRQAGSETCSSPTTTRWASRRRSTRTSSSASTAISAGTSISGASIIGPSGIATKVASRCTSSAVPTRKCESRRRERLSLFSRGERIWTESSYKYEPNGIVEMGAAVGLRRARSMGRFAGRIRTHAARGDLIDWFRGSRFAVRGSQLAA